MQPKFPLAPVAPNNTDSALAAVKPLAGAAEAPAKALSAGFRSALGKKPAGFHDSAKGTKAELVRQAKSNSPAMSAKPVQARHSHIGPRSGHK